MHFVNKWKLEEAGSKCQEQNNQKNKDSHKYYMIPIVHDIILQKVKTAKASKTLNTKIPIS